MHIFYDMPPLRWFYANVESDDQQWAHDDINSLESAQIHPVIMQVDYEHVGSETPAINSVK